MQTSLITKMLMSRNNKTIVAIAAIAFIGFTHASETASLRASKTYKKNVTYMKCGEHHLVYRVNDFDPVVHLIDKKGEIVKSISPIAPTDSDISSMTAVEIFNKHQLPVCWPNKAYVLHHELTWIDVGDGEVNPSGYKGVFRYSIKTGGSSFVTDDLDFKLQTGVGLL